MMVEANRASSLFIEPVQPKLVAIARFLVEELLMQQSQDHAVTVGFGDGSDQRLALRRRTPRPREHQSLVRHDLPDRCR